VSEEGFFVLEEDGLNARQKQIVEIFRELDLPLAPAELLNVCEEDRELWQTRINTLVERLMAQGLLRPELRQNFSVPAFLNREFPTGPLAGRLLQFRTMDSGFSSFNEICHATDSSVGVQGQPPVGTVPSPGNTGHGFSRNLSFTGDYSSPTAGMDANEGVESTSEFSSPPGNDEASPGRGRFYRPDISDSVGRSALPPSSENSGSPSPRGSAETGGSKSGISRQWEKITDFLEPANLKQEIKQKIAEMDVGFDIKMLDVESFAGVGLSSKYRYEVKPSYEKDFYTRVDGWELKLKLKPGDWVPEYDLPISLSMDNGVKINFVRQFESQREAAKAIPYTPKRLPFRAKSAIENLEPGDFVSLPAHMNIIVNAGLSTTEGIFSAGVNTHYLMSGEF
jgi:hypothetical protein